MFQKVHTLAGQELLDICCIFLHNTNADICGHEYHENSWNIFKPILTSCICSGKLTHGSWLLIAKPYLQKEHERTRKNVSWCIVLHHPPLRTFSSIHVVHSLSLKKAVCRSKPNKGIEIKLALVLRRNELNMKGEHDLRGTQAHWEGGWWALKGIIAKTCPAQYSKSHSQ